MLRSLDSLEKGFQRLAKKSKEECGKELEKLHQSAFLSSHFIALFYNCFRKNREKEKWGMCLYHACLMDLARISGHIVFLAYYGLYRNAFDNVRYAIESIVQALYIDHRHPETSLSVKIEILKEVENKRGYHAARLIDELEIDYKERLRKEYKELSRIIHPSHKHIVSVLREIRADEPIPATVDCEEILRIYDSMIKMYDIFFFLIANYFPELQKALKTDKGFVKSIRLYNLYLLSKALKVDL